MPTCGRMIYCVLRGLRGNNSLMRATSSVRVRTRLPAEARGSGPRERGGWLWGESGAWQRCPTAWPLLRAETGGKQPGAGWMRPCTALPASGRWYPKAGCDLPLTQGQLGEGKESKGGFCVSRRCLTAATLFALQDMTYLCISASDSSSQNL